MTGLGRDTESKGLTYSGGYSCLLGRLGCSFGLLGCLLLSFVSFVYCNVILRCEGPGSGADSSGACGWSGSQFVQFGRLHLKLPRRGVYGSWSCLSMAKCWNDGDVGVGGGISSSSNTSSSGVEMLYSVSLSSNALAIVWLKSCSEVTARLAS